MTRVDHSLALQVIITQNVCAEDNYCIVAQHFNLPLQSYASSSFGFLSGRYSCWLSETFETNHFIKSSKLYASFYFLFICVQYIFFNFRVVSLHCSLRTIEHFLYYPMLRLLLALCPSMLDTVVGCPKLIQEISLQSLHSCMPNCYLIFMCLAIFFYFRVVYNKECTIYRFVCLSIYNYLQS